MEFATPPEIIQAIKDRLDQRILGYTNVFDPDYYLSVVKLTQDHYNWTFIKNIWSHHLVLFPRYMSWSSTFVNQTKWF